MLQLLMKLAAVAIVVLQSTESVSSEAVYIEGETLNGMIKDLIAGKPKGELEKMVRYVQGNLDVLYKDLASDVPQLVDPLREIKQEIKSGTIVPIEETIDDHVNLAASPTTSCVDDDGEDQSSVIAEAGADDDENLNADIDDESSIDDDNHRKDDEDVQSSADDAAHSIDDNEDQSSIVAEAGDDIDDDEHSNFDDDVQSNVDDEEYRNDHEESTPIDDDVKINGENGEHIRADDDGPNNVDGDEEHSNDGDDSSNDIVDEDTKMAVDDDDIKAQGIADDERDLSAGAPSTEYERDTLDLHVDLIESLLKNEATRPGTHSDAARDDEGENGRMSPSEKMRFRISI